ncbi:helix-turn-helix transcriptional regulator [Pseudomonas indica]|uniref:AraC-type DNA-binding protein n=1 Tax=Pseudomonas indica TaxID=137658 RepID=A0A1G8XUT4_9PSED|nr:response regulator transcription factor [Pseudomonas indica]SDJ94281.1 AraC-type DNA-binding protein [Pseudomonas indica]
MNSRTAVPQLLWFDLTHDRSAQDFIPLFADVCQIDLARDLSVAGIDTRRRPDMICMHYDRPDSLGLGLLLELKNAIPSIPITMLTQQHSEELAVWAFRSGTWDYLVLPLTDPECARYLSALQELCKLRREPREDRKNHLPRTHHLPESVRLTPDFHKQQSLQKAVRYIEQHYTEQIDGKTMAQLCGMTPFRFSRLFKQTHGIGFVEFVLQKRMERAKDLLCNSQMPVTSIAYTVGFKDPSYFARAFKQYFECSPSDFRRDGPPKRQVAQANTLQAAQKSHDLRDAVPGF